MQRATYQECDGFRSNESKEQFFKIKLQFLNKIPNFSVFFFALAKDIHPPTSSNGGEWEGKKWLLGNVGIGRGK